MRPFEGVRVIDLTHVLAGPSCTYQLALLGADVIKIERPFDGDQTRTTGTDYRRAAEKMATSYLAHHANKRCITLDLKSKDGQEVLKKLVKTADVMVQNFRPGALKKLGLSYEEMSAINPRLIYASVSGYGHRGPNASRTATDQTIQGTTGIMHTTGTAEVSPLLTTVNFVDYGSGVYAAFGIASALYQRDRTGKGQHVDVSMYDVALAFMANHVNAMLNGGNQPKAKGNAFDRATTGVYETKDGLLVLAGVNMPQQKEIWELLGRPDLVKTDEVTRRTDFPREYATMVEIMKTRTAAEWEEFFNKNNVPASEVRYMTDGIADPHLDARSFIHRFDEVPGVEGPVSVITSPMVFDHDGPRVDTPPARHGEHTDEVLKEIGLSATEIERLRASRVIGPELVEETA